MRLSVGQEHSATRAGDADQALHSLDLLVFDGKDKSLDDATFLYSRTAYTSGGSSYQAVLLQADSLDVYFAVNAHTLATNGSITEGMTWSAVKELFTLNTDPATLAANIDNQGLPMWGMYKGLCIDKGSAYKNIGTISLVRAVALADVTVSDATFTLSQGWIADAVTTGYLPFSEANRSAAGSNVFDKPDVPVSPVYKDWKYDVPTGGLSIANQLYMYENDVTPRPSKLILAGKWGESQKTDSTFYPLAFVATDNASAVRAVTRNTKFYIVITKVNGDGYNTLEEAKKGEPQNMDYQVVDWDQQQDGDILVDGTKYLILDKRWSDIHIGPSVGSYTTLSFTTNYDLTQLLMKPKGDTGNGSNTTASTTRFRLDLLTTTSITEATFKVSSLEAYDASATDLTQEFTVTCAGKLTFDIKVTQDANDPMDWHLGYPTTVDEQ
jgi:hypothetical protein